MTDPRTRLVLVGCAGVLAVALESPVALGAFVVLCASPLLFLDVPRRWWLRGLLVVATLVWSTVLSQGLFYSEQPRVALVSLGPLTLWREGVTWGLTQSLRFVGLSLAGLALAVSTPADRLFAALVKLRVPFGLALMGTTALRLLPQLAQELLIVRRARAARGRPAHHRGPLAWLRLEIGLLRPVVARCWRRAQNLAESLDARGFDPLASRRLRRPLRFGAVDLGVLAGALLLTTCVAGARVAYVLYVSDALYLPQLRALYGFVRAWL